VTSSLASDRAYLHRTLLELRAQGIERVVWISAGDTDCCAPCRRRDARDVSIDLALRTIATDWCSSERCRCSFMAIPPDGAA
jgi:hypothetical protein